MKRIFLIIFLSSFISSVSFSQSKLSLCQGENKSSYNNCFGKIKQISSNSKLEYIYEGEFKNGKEHGQGSDTYSNGKKFIGEYKEGKRSGKGILTHPDGNRYVGEFKNDAFDGQGIYTYSDGTKYVGEFKNGKEHGQGTQTYSKGYK